MQNQALLAMDHAEIVDARIQRPQPRARVTEHDGHARERHEMLLIGEIQLILVDGIDAETEAER